MSESAVAPKRRALGRGLSALIGDAPAPTATPIERRVLVSEIRPNPRQPRRFFDEDRIAELADSIRHQGVLQPLVVRKMEDGYELIIGERRFRAAQHAGLDRVPVVIKDVSEAESLEMALVENIQREELTPIEEALAYRQLMEEFHFTQEEMAQRVGKSRPVVTNLLRILQLPEEIKEEVDRGHLSVGHARALLALGTPEQQVELARKIMRQGLSVRETETLVSHTLPAQPALATAQEDQPQRDEIYLHIAALQDDLMRSLGTKVRLHPKKKGGRLEIEYYSNEELEGLVRRLKGQ
ncbi:MAG: ParB/RepB/Spo0J family partition protein [Deltaproteobacteria bacterium]|nr:ParB/RepB/Spo0J family partition protein [Deltaproteobacteria bacterium]